MAIGPGDDLAWGDLGDALIQRRIELSPRYKNRRLFCEGRQIGQRLAYDIEEAKRTNFGRATMLDIARAYQVTPASMDRKLHRQGELEPVVPRPLAVAPDPEPEPEPPSVPVSFETVTKLVRPAIIASATAIRSHAEAVLARNPAGRGADIFPGEPDLAAQWDLTPSLPVAEKSWYAAIARFGRSEAKSGLPPRSGAIA